MDYRLHNIPDRLGKETDDYLKERADKEEYIASHCHNCSIEADRDDLSANGGICDRCLTMELA